MGPTVWFIAPRALAFGAGVVGPDTFLVRALAFGAGSVCSGGMVVGGPARWPSVLAFGTGVFSVRVVMFDSDP